jgi:hypothetical protein
VPRKTELKECVPTCCNCDLQDRESPHPASYRERSHAKQELQRRRNLQVTTPGSARTFLLEITTPDRSFTAALQSSNQQHPQQPSPPPPPKESSGKNMQQDTNQISGQPQPVHTKNVKNNSTDVFLALIMVQQIITELLGAAIEKDKVADITKAC